MKKQSHVYEKKVNVVQLPHVPVCTKSKTSEQAISIENYYIAKVETCSLRRSGKDCNGKQPYHSYLKAVSHSFKFNLFSNCASLLPKGKLTEVSKLCLYPPILFTTL